MADDDSDEDIGKADLSGRRTTLDYDSDEGTEETKTTNENELIDLGASDEESTQVVPKLSGPPL